MDSALKNIDFRWGLYNRDTEVGLAFGIFKYTTTEELIYTDTILDAGSAAKNYILRIWVHNNGTAQTELLNKSFKGNISVTSESIEYTDESCFTFDEPTGAITGYDISCGTDVVIPKKINGTTVSILGDSSFYFYNEDQIMITSAIIPDVITSIGLYAFQESKITQITIPDSVRSLEAWAFSCTNNLSTIFLPESVVAFPTDPDRLADDPENISQVFSDNKIKTIVIPGSIKVISVTSFYNNPLNDIILMNGITKIYDRSFSDNKVSSVEIPSSVNIIEDCAFCNGESTRTLNKIILRGKTEIPSTFETDWNLAYSEYNKDNIYAEVEYRP